MATAPASTMSTEPPAPRNTTAASHGWLFGPTADLLLGCGLLYMLFFGVFALGGETLRGLQPVYLFPLCALLISTPHYGATILRVYEQRSERRAYAVFAVWITAALCALFVIGVHHPPTTALLLTIYMTWSPWHYTGQNFGLSMLFLRRRGVDPSQHERRWLHLSFVTSYVLTFLVMHGGALRSTDTPLAYAGAPIPFLSLDLPGWLMTWALPLSAAAYAGTSLVAAGLLVQRAGMRAAAPSLLLVVTQGLWFTFPLLFHYFGIESGLDPIDRHYTHYFFWAAIGHAVQYLWITAYTARSSAGWTGLGRYLGKTLVAGLALFTLPVVVFAPDALGSLSFTAGLGILLTAIVNIHHFILDGAIWKLRSPRVRALLLREPEPHAREDGGGWLRPAVWAVAATAVPIAIFGFWTEYASYSSALASGDLRGAARHLDRLSWVGRDSEVRRAELARAFGERGDYDAAALQLERRIALAPSVEGWIALADLELRADRPEAILRATEQGLALAPERPYLHLRAAQAARKLGRLDEARAHLARARALAPDNPTIEAEGRRIEALQRQ